MAQIIEGNGCDSNADYVIYTGPRPDDYTHACEWHVGKMLIDGENKVLPVETPMDSPCCYINTHELSASIIIGHIDGITILARREAV